LDTERRVLARAAPVKQPIKLAEGNPEIICDVGQMPTVALAPLL
jgi:hypothetical protein